MKRNKNHDWTRVLQERLQDARLPLEDDFASFAGNCRRAESSRWAAAGTNRVAWWPWALAGVAAAAVAVFFLLRPVPPREPERLVQPQPVLPDAPSVLPDSSAVVPVAPPVIPVAPPVIPDRIGDRSSVLADSSPSWPLGGPAAARRWQQDTSLVAGIPAGQEKTEEATEEQKIPGQAGNDGKERAGNDRRDQARDDGKDQAGNDGIGDSSVSLAELAVKDLPEEPDRVRRATRKPRLTLLVQASSAGRSFPAGRTLPETYDYNGQNIASSDFSWNEVRTKMTEITDYAAYNSYNATGSALGSNNGTQHIHVVQVMAEQTVVRSVPQAPALPVSFGLNGELAFGRRWSLLSGLEYSQRAGYRMYGENPQALTLHYLGVPLETRFHFLPDKRFRLYLGTGLKAEKCFLATGGEPLRDPFLFSWNLQAGADFRIVPGLRVYLAPVVSQYLNRSAYDNRWDRAPQVSLRAGLSFDL